MFLWLAIIFQLNSCAASNRFINRRHSSVFAASRPSSVVSGSSLKGLSLPVSIIMGAGIGAATFTFLDLRAAFHSISRFLWPAKKPFVRIIDRITLKQRKWNVKSKQGNIMKWSWTESHIKKEQFNARWHGFKNWLNTIASRGQQTATAHCCCGEKKKENQS